MSWDSLGRRFGAAFLRLVCGSLTLIEVLVLLLTSVCAWGGIAAGEGARAAVAVVLLALSGLLVALIIHVARWGGTLLIEEVEMPGRGGESRRGNIWADFLDHDFLPLVRTSVIFVFVIMGLVGIAAGIGKGWDDCHSVGVGLSALLAYSIPWSILRIQKSRAESA